MKGNFSELKEKGLDFEEILQSYVNKNERENEDDLFIDEENMSKTNSDRSQEDSKELEISKIHSEFSFTDKDKLCENLGAIANYKTFKPENIESHKQVNIIEKEMKQEGEITIYTWMKFLFYGLGILGSIIMIFFI